MTAVSGSTEAALVARWGAGELTGRWLRTATGDTLTVLFVGRPGGAAGPDFRDAVLLRPDGSRVYGDVELHLRARGWQAHGHARDARYNHVVLHVVERAQGAHATPLASGGWAPILEVGNTTPLLGAGPAGVCAARWPCADLAVRRVARAIQEVLEAAGDERFALHVARFAAALARGQSAGGRAAAPPASVAAWEGYADHNGSARAERRTVGASPGGKGAGEQMGKTGGTWSEVDRVLSAALAEGLAYGRDREPLRRAGEWLADGGAPDVLLRELPRLPVLDARRLEGLLDLLAGWLPAGPWVALRAAIVTGTPAAGARALIDALEVSGGVISRGRAAILAANVVLPCAAAWAARIGEVALAERARAVYAALPGLPSNQITREMVRQLGLRRQPAGACAQQGLHHLWERHCREKRCAGCPCAGR